MLKLLKRGIEMLMLPIAKKRAVRVAKFYKDKQITLYEVMKEGAK